MVLSIIIPCFNEHEYLAEILNKIKAVELPGISKEIIVVDDGSSDGSAAVVESGFPDVILIRSDHNYGKAHAIRAGLEKAGGELILIQDADLEYDPADYSALLVPFIKDRAQVVYGSRILQKENGKSSELYYLGGRFLSLVTNILYGAKITDEATGYKLFKRQLLLDLHLRANRFEFCPEVTAKILKRGIPIVEVPIHYYPRNRSEGKKINAFKDGWLAVWTLIKYKFIKV